MITGMWCSTHQCRELLPDDVADHYSTTERLSYSGGSNTSIQVTHSGCASYRNDTGSFYTQHHVDAGVLDKGSLYRKATRSKLLESTGLSVQLRNKD